MKILIDNGHGKDTSGKCSPDGRLLEWLYCREIATAIVSELCRLGYDAERIVTEDIDIRLAERCRRVNSICKQVGANNVLLISVHNNAAKSDGWHGASGWSGWVAPNASLNSKRLATLLYEEAERLHLRGNRSVPKCKYWIGNFAIVRDTDCPAVLTENLFQDNKDEVDFLLSDEGKRAIVDLHVKGIINYIKSV